MSETRRGRERWTNRKKKPQPSNIISMGHGENPPACPFVSSSHPMQNSGGGVAFGMNVITCLQDMKPSPVPCKFWDAHNEECGLLGLLDKVDDICVRLDLMDPGDDDSGDGKAPDDSGDNGGVALVAGGKDAETKA